jgi:hypothetical protein
MIKLTFKSLITLLATSSALLLTPMKSYAQVNMDRLAQVAKSCQRDALNIEYYKKIGIDESSINYKLEGSPEELLNQCIYSRYHYSSIISILPWIASAGEMLSKYPGSVAVAASANYLWSPADVDNVINCFTTQSASSQECKRDPFSSIAPGRKMGENYSSMTTAHLSSLIITKGYNFYVCPSCVVTHDNIVSSETIVSAFIQWFLRLEKPKRREIIYLLGDQNESGILRNKIANESREAVNEYWKVRARVEQQEQERRRQELLGN